MTDVTRLGAIAAGTAAVVFGAVDLSWWFSARWYAFSVGVGALAFLIGLVGFFATFGLLISRLPRRKSRAIPVDVLGRVLRRVPLRLLVVLAVLLASAIVGASHASAAAGKWGTDPAYSWHHCPWPLTTNHGSVHACVSHARWLEVDHATARIFAAFALGLLSIDCLVLTTLSRFPTTARPA